MTEDFLVVIPARGKSTRFPNKPLTDIAGKTMIQRTYGQCAKAVDLEKIFVATDSREIYDHCISNNLNVEMTPENCLTGTDRIAEFAKIHQADYYINVQGDEPVINPEDIKNILDQIPINPNAVINGYAKISDERDYFSLSVPKVVLNDMNDLMYMSRSPIPGNKEGVFRDAYRQVCIYSFPSQMLRYFGVGKKKGVVEQAEDIEILRFLESGVKVKMIELSGQSIAVDHPSDVDKVLAWLSNEN
ncbi:3-deoxy-manno-octulosonate cytidylyltransferase [Marinoscillum sp.]|uniref:3-deoxy-manno-octulosonate cytidylyltransferase n=1 Tax=Marinoscillum sp. TaxID=2024838 RepID=UPI003BAA9641